MIFTNTISSNSLTRGFLSWPPTSPPTCPYLLTDFLGIQVLIRNAPHYVTSSLAPAISDTCPSLIPVINLIRNFIFMTYGLDFFFLTKSYLASAANTVLNGVPRDDCILFSTRKNTPGGCLAFLSCIFQLIFFFDNQSQSVFICCTEYMSINRPTIPSNFQKYWKKITVICLINNTHTIPERSTHCWACDEQPFSPFKQSRLRP